MSTPRTYPPGPTAATAGVFREFDLPYEELSTEPTGYDEFDRPIYEVTPRKIRVNLETYLFAQIRYAPGADPHIIRGKGSLVRPAVFPQDLRVGQTFPVDWLGQPGELVLDQITPGPLEDLDGVLGQEFLYTIRLT